jgi:branched-chain amino acid transport system ATP-binding protein
VTLLALRQITKTFGGLVALDRLDLAVREREVVGLIGPNGSGKSTCLNVISGVLRPGSGQVLLDGTEVTGLAPWQIARRGITRTFQRLRIFPELSVLDNVRLAQHAHLATGLAASAAGTARARREEAGIVAEARRILGLVGLDRLERRAARELSIGQRRLLELARGLAARPRVFMLDEPAAGLSPPNVDRLIALVRRMRDEWGITIVLVEHVMKVVMQLSDRVVVLDHGVKIADGPPDVVAADARVIEAYLGTGAAGADR